MNLSEYFFGTSGKGVLATASSDGVVDAAIYSRPHVLDNERVAFIMRQRLTHSNLQSNPFATYLFLEDGGGYKGLRLFLKKTGEDQDAALLAQMSRRHLSPEEDAAQGPKFLVYFKVEKVLELIGGDSLQ